MKYQCVVKGTLVLALIAAMASCSTESLSELDRTQYAFIDQINGKIATTQMWRTAVTLRVDVAADDSVKLWLMSGKDTGTLYDYRELPTSGRVDLTMPQGNTNTAYLVSVCHRQKEITPITLTGKSIENISLTVSREYKDYDEETQPADRQRAIKATTDEDEPVEASINTKAALYGNSIIGNGKYNELTSEQRREALYILRNFYQEFVPAKKVGMNCDYELESKGDFDITWFAGNCSSVTPHVLGYYYHSPGTYEDIQYVDLSETEIYDYIDGLAKVQYKVNEKAAAQYGVKADHWYDANFDMYDVFENPSTIYARQNDDAYNSIAVYNRYGDDITALRGISFKISVPHGKRIGFYDRSEDVALPEQYDRFVRMGIKPYTSRDKFKAMNFTCEAMNMNINGAYRSGILKSNNAYWMGMENDYTGGDLDCNDVMFEVSSELEIHRPSIVEPDLKPFGEYTDKQPWTLAFEDVYRNSDFDFNDAVVKLVPDFEKEECCVTVMAVGSTSKMYLHYNGPDGDVNLGELHDLLGGTPDQMINTQLSYAEMPFVQVGCVKWLKGYTMEQDAKRFYVEVQRGTCKDCSDIITLAEKPGEMPQALLVAGEWKWPREGINIINAYPNFAKWAKNNTLIDNWNWYGSPTYNAVVNY